MEAIAFILKGERFHPETKILVNSTLGIFRGVVYKNKQTQLSAEILHIICVTEKSINPYIPLIFFT